MEKKWFFVEQKGDQPIVEAIFETELGLVEYPFIYNPTIYELRASGEKLRRQDLEVEIMEKLS